MSLEIVFFLLKRLSRCLCIWHKKKSNPVTEQYTSKYNSEIRFQIAALWQSSRNVLSSFNSNIHVYAFFFVSFFYQGVNSFEKLWKWVLCKTYGLKKCYYMIFTKMKFWSEMKGQVCCNTVYEDQYPQSRKKNIVLHVYCVGEYQYKYKIVRGLYQ